MRLLVALATSALVAGCGPPRLEVPVTVRGHAEVVILADGTALPLVLRQDRPVGLCLAVAPEVDTSQWEAELLFDARSAGGLAPAAARMGSTLCFDALLPADLGGDQDLELCGRVVDRFDGSRWRSPCRKIRYRPDDEVYRELRGRVDELLSRPFAGGLEELLERLDRIRAESGGRYPILEVRLELAATHFLTVESTPQTLAAARRRLAALPGWLDHEAASVYRGQAAYQRALSHLYGEPDLERAWRALAEAESAFVRVAWGFRLVVAMQQVDVLAKLGAEPEARRRLRAALADCGRSRCTPGFLPYARGHLAWLILVDPAATDTDLAEAEAHLEAGLADLGESAPLESANQHVSLAYLRLRQGGDPRPELARAERLLARSRLAAEPVDRLRAYAELIAAHGLLETGDAAAATRRCGALTASAEAAVSAWAWSCLGRAARARGDSDGAREAFERARDRYALVEPPEIGQHLPLGRGQRAELFAEAARAAVEAGDPAAAWDTLAHLDRLASREADRRRCRQRAGDPAAQRRWREVDDARAALFAELRELEAPAAGLRQRQLEGRRRQVRERLWELWWEWPGCPRNASGGDPAADYRAVALSDEVLVLHRRRGAVELLRRTPFDRGELRRLADEVAAALERRDVADDAWRRLVAPLAPLLLPEDVEEPPPSVSFALHGWLQEVPLAALPLPAPGPAGERWLGERTAVVLVPAGAADPDRAVAAKGAGAPLVVVDPREDLPGARELLAASRELFPEARILAGADAGADAFAGALAGAPWLHVDAHGLYDAAVPELSALELADRPLTLMELAELPAPRWFVNLSGCRTGRWPATPDSGRYGLGGLFSRLGARWVVANRASLADRVARDFNFAFYRALRRERQVPEAYRRALARIARDHPAASWAGIVLLGAGEGANAARADSP